MKKILKHIDILVKSFRMFGYSGVFLAFRMLYLKSSKTSNRIFKLKGLKNKIHLRLNSTDFSCFTDIMLDQSYNINIAEPEWIIDCGANIGLGTIFFKEKYPNTKIVAVEMEEENFEMLEKNTNSYNNVFLEKAAIWSSSGEDLTIVDWDREWGYLVTDENKELLSKKVKSITINNIIEKYNLKVIDLVKIDIEGAEKEVFGKGENSWLWKTKILIIELHDRINPGSSKALFDSLAKHNFSLSLQGENLIFKLND